MGNPDIFTNAACYNMLEFKQTDCTASIKPFPIDSIIYYFISTTTVTVIELFKVIIIYYN